MSEQEYEEFKAKLGAKLKATMETMTEERYSVLATDLTEYCKENANRTQLECLTAFVLAQLAALTVHVEFTANNEEITKTLMAEIVAEEKAT